MKIGYICTNFNNSHFTVEAVRTLVASATPSHEVRIIVVDNRSSPNHRRTLLALEREYPCVDVLMNEENVGYFPGLNLGINYLRSQYPDFIHLIIGNNDLKFPITFCSQMQNHCDLLNEHAVISPDILTLDGEHQNPHVIKTISNRRELIYDVYYSHYYLAQTILWLARVSKRFTDRSDESQHGIAQHIYQGHGSCYLIGPMFFKHFTELWAPTFLMGEEYFLSKQLSDRDLQVYYTPSVQVIHCCHGSLKSVPSRIIWQFARKAHLEYRKYVNPFRTFKKTYDK